MNALQPASRKAARQRASAKHVEVGVAAQQLVLQRQVHAVQRRVRLRSSFSLCTLYMK